MTDAAGWNVPIRSSGRGAPGKTTQNKTVKTTKILLLFLSFFPSFYSSPTAMIFDNKPTYLPEHREKPHPKAPGWPGR